MVCGVAAPVAELTDVRGPFLETELEREVGVLVGVPFFSSCSRLRAFRSAHHIVMDWLRFSLLTRGLRREPEAGDVSST